jgi:DNA-nicking Smr family endonuclease
MMKDPREEFREYLDEFPPDRTALEKDRPATSQPVPDRNRIAASLDLHGQVAVEAERLVGIFLEDARRQGYGLVAIVTGKGLHSEKQAVLPTLIRQGLAAGRYGKTRSHRNARAREGGSGVILVEL